MLLRPFKSSAAIILMLLGPGLLSSATGYTKKEASALRTFAAGASSGPITIHYDLVHVSGNIYKYIYTITNNAPGGYGAPVRLFDILFDTSLYAENTLQIVTPSGLHSQWSEVVLASLPGSPALYDSLALQGGIPAGTSVSGFSVQFTYLGTGTPGVQPFQIFDPGTFQLLQTGQTAGDSTVGAPASSTLSLIAMGIGLAGIAGYRALAYRGA